MKINFSKVVKRDIKITEMMDEKAYQNLLEKAILASKTKPTFIKTKGFFKWRFYTVEELNEKIVFRNNKILLHNESKVNGKSVEKKVQILPLKKRGKTSHTRYDKIKTYESNVKTENNRSDIFLINELTKSNIFYAIHASFVGTSRYKFKLLEDGRVKFINQKMILIR